MNLFLSLVLAAGLHLTLSLPASTGQSLGSPFIQSAVEDAKKLVDEAYKYSREKSLERVRREATKPSDVLRLMKQPVRDTRSAVRAADYLENSLRLIHERAHRIHKRSINATDLLTEEELEVIVRVSGCEARTRPPSCRTTPNLAKFRTATSVCNNLKDPFLGASNTPFTRWLRAEYDDGVSVPRGFDRTKTFNNFLLPLVREVSNRILKTTDADVVSDPEFSHFLTIFGQWIDHDLTFTPFSPSIRSFSSGLDCDESCERSDPCFPIQIPRGDPRLPTGPDSCLPVFRSAPVCGTGTTAFLFGGVAEKREQINALTAFLDMGQVYGSEEGLAKDLRNLDDDGGLLRVNANFTDSGRELLPFSTMEVNTCATRQEITGDTDAPEVPCFIAGDTRSNENVALTTIHTFFLREHNRLARALRRLNPHWDGETLYQQARKIMGAYSQLFVFRDYLPVIVGDEAMKRLLGPYPGYDENVNPSIANMFATAAFRFAHPTIQPTLFRLDGYFRENRQFSSIPLFKGFSTPWRVVFEGGIDSLLRGLLRRPAKLNTQDSILVEALRDKLYAFVEDLALDLGSLNMQRGRDHGIPAYNAWRKFCGLPAPRNHVELAQVLNNPSLAHRLLQLYGTPANIDVWLGGVAEPFVRGGRVGPLFACIIATQFQRIREGDRLWYESPGVFTPRQMAALSTASLNRIICDNTGITSVPADPFSVKPGSSRLIPCSSVPRVDLSVWRDRGCSISGERCYDDKGSVLPTRSQQQCHSAALCFLPGWVTSASPTPKTKRKGK